MTDLARLSDHFPPDRVSWRVGSTTNQGEKVRGLALAYVDARDIMDRLDEVLGAANWQDKYRREHETTICSLSLRIDGEWITKEDGSGDTDVEAEKGALSKALVRAAVKWQIGRYLYDLPSPWVDCDKRGKSVVIKPEEHGRLRALLSKTFRQAPASAPEAFRDSAPASDEEDGSKDRYVASCLKRIRSEKDAVELRNWWLSDEERQARRDFGLSQDEVDHLKTAFGDRLKVIATPFDEDSAPRTNGHHHSVGRQQPRDGTRAQ